MSYEVKQQDKFKFIEEGNGEPLMLLHGLFGAISNFTSLIGYFRNYNKVVVPMLPLFDLDILHSTVGGLAKFVHRFIEARGYTNVHLLGNSLGGHVALKQVLKHPEHIKSLILTGSSGLFESAMGDTGYIRVNLTLQPPFQSVRSGPGIHAYGENRTWQTMTEGCIRTTPVAMEYLRLHPINSITILPRK